MQHVNNYYTRHVSYTSSPLHNYLLNNNNNKSEITLKKQDCQGEHRVHEYSQWW